MLVNQQEATYALECLKHSSNDPKCQGWGGVACIPIAVETSGDWVKRPKHLLATSISFFNQPVLLKSLFSEVSS